LKKIEREHKKLPRGKRSDNLGGNGLGQHSWGGYFFSWGKGEFGEEGGKGNLVATGCYNVRNAASLYEKLMMGDPGKSSLEEGEGEESGKV